MAFYKQVSVHSLKKLLNAFKAAFGVYVLLFAMMAQGAVIISNTAKVNDPADPYRDPAGGTGSLLSNDGVPVDIIWEPLPTDSVLKFYKYSPTAQCSQGATTAPAQTLPFAGGRYEDALGNLQSLPTNLSVPGVGSAPSVVDFSAPTPVCETQVFHEGEPVFVTLEDHNRNADPALVETVLVTLKSASGDIDEVIELRETGPDTGIFAAVIQSTTDPVVKGDGKITVGIDGWIRGHYQDASWPADVSEAEALVDPFGILFDASDNTPLNGATVTLVDVNKPGCSAVTSSADPLLAGCGATVFMDDGVSPHPAQVVTGTTVAGNPAVPPGGFRYPLIPPGKYRLVVDPPAGYSLPSSLLPACATPPCANGLGRSIVTGSHLQDFIVLPGPALHIDIPADPSQNTMLMVKSVSKTEASAGDYLQYRLQVTNNSAAGMATTTITDIFPVGMRYQTGSLHINGVQQPDPVISADGRTMTITMTPGLGATGSGTDKAAITYVLAVSAGAVKGDAINTAQAQGPSGVVNGTLRSNIAQVAVRVRDPLMSGAFTIIGRVFEGDCSVPFAEQKGVPNVRLLMEDGTYVVTDQDGQYHFEGVKPGTHVVQMDTVSLPKGWEPVSCIQNTRFAGSAYSQFVDARGGALWRADFHVRAPLVLEKPAEIVAEVKPEAPVIPDGEAGIRLQTLESVQVSELTKELAPRSYTFYGRFASGDDALLPQSRGLLEKLGNDLKKGKVLRIEVLGHTDSQGLSARAKAKFTDNYGLGLARAKMIASYLKEKLNLSDDQIVTTGIGPDRPLASNKTASGMAKNRRVEVVVVGAMGPTTAKVGERARRQHRIVIDTGKVPAFNLRTTVMLPPDLAYVKGSTLIDGKPMPDPEQMDGMLVWRIAAEAPKEKSWEEIKAETERGGATTEPAPIGWQRIVTFNTEVVRKVVTTKPAADKTYTFNGRFEPAQAELMDESVSELEQLQESLRQAGTIERLEIVGYTDNQRLSARARKIYPDNQALSLARARTIADFLKVGLGLSDDKIIATGKGDADPVASNKTAAGMAQNRRVELKVFTQEAAQTRLQKMCQNGYISLKAMATVDTQAANNVSLPVVENRMPCVDGNGQKPAANKKSDTQPENSATQSAVMSADGSVTETTQASDSVSGVSTVSAPQQTSAVADETKTDSGRQVKALKPFIPVAEEKPAADSATKNEEATVEEPVVEEKTSAESIAADDIDWLAKTSGKVGFLFPDEKYNPRSPTTRVVVEHGLTQKVVVTVNDEAVSPLNFDGIRRGGVNGSAVSIWRALPLKEGPNRVVARVYNADQTVDTELVRIVYFSNTPARVELVPEKSVLVADGMTRPVIALRMLDRFGAPVRDGVSGDVLINSPYMSWQQQQETQRRQLAGLDAFKPQYVVKGDDGIALIELAPTTVSGMANLDFEFQSESSNTRSQTIKAWLEPAAREWVMVGFAEGTVGYNTLKDNVVSLQAQGVEEGAYTDGKVSFYAKGSVLGKWILTMAYDTSKARDKQSLMGTIDPNEFYTLYGDGAEQRYDAASQSKLYLKLERGQFYALFGDYDSGLNETQLSRYNRTLNGFKTEKAGGTVVFTAYAAETEQNHARDEIRGNGTSGLYRLTQPNIVLNTEQIRIETRDRLHSQTILQSRTLSRHIDYDIDYSAGTIFFKQPVYGQDSSFNPIWIVAEYETHGVADRVMNAGGRIGLNLLKDSLKVGLTALHDESGTPGTGGKSELLGADLKYRFDMDSELRIELAGTTGDKAGVPRDGQAWLAELERHNGRYDLLLYARNQEVDFGVNQQSLSEAGQLKIGANTTLRLNRDWAWQSEVFQQENLSNDNTRQAVTTKLRYETKAGSASIGVQVIRDNAETGPLAGQSFNSQQLVLGGNRWFMKRKLELSAQAETGTSDSADYPNRFVLGAGYAFTDHVKLIAGQEFTDGADLTTSNTRVGMQVVPWKGARLDSTLNQSQMSEYGPRTFAQLGLTQSLQLGKQWGVDFGIDSSQSIGNQQARPEINNSQTTSNNLGMLGLGTSRVTALTEDYFAVTTGATYRADIWSWTGRLESRDGTQEDRYGLTSNFLREARAGVAFATGMQAFHTESAASTGNQLSLDLSWAFRPLGTQWSVLNRLEFKYEEAENTTALATPPPGGLFGFTSLVANAAKSRRVINNFALNRVSREWTGEDRTGNLFRRYERNQWSLYYGSKYSFDTYDGIDYSGYTDMLAVEVRHDIKPWLDIGLQASTLNSWSTGTHAYSFGPQIGASPVRNGWITLGWNIRGFTDRDFDAARYSAQGPYLQLRLKFDQNTRLNRDMVKANPSMTTDSLSPVAP